MAEYIGASDKRVDDERLSEEISNFLDNTFYKQLTKDFQRVYDFDKQVLGVDVEFTINGVKYVVDEKASHSRRNLGTFALELSMLNRAGCVQEGWYTRLDQINNAYLFVWLDKNWHRKGETITVALVSKDNLNKYTDSLGWMKSRLRKKAKKIREGSDDKFGNIKDNGCLFFFSKKLHEQPVNLLLPREVYINLAEVVWTSDYSQDPVKNS